MTCNSMVQEAFACHGLMMGLSHMLEDARVIFPLLSGFRSTQPFTHPSKNHIIVNRNQRLTIVSPLNPGVLVNPLLTTMSGAKNISTSGAGVLDKDKSTSFDSLSVFSSGNL